MTPPGGSTNPTTGTASSGGTAAACPTCTIDTETIATQPADRTRHLLGVGEEVRCTFSLGSARWTVSGGGRLSSDSGATITFTAPDVDASCTLTARGSNCTAVVVFIVLAPISVCMVRRTEVEHNISYPDVGMGTNIYFGPDSVSFYNIQYHEVDCPCVADGVYSCQDGEGHDASPATLDALDRVISGKGTQMNARDHVYSGYCGQAPANPTGTELFPIPYEYRVRGRSFHPFETVDQCVRCMANGDVEATKAGARAKTEVMAPTVTI